MNALLLLSSLAFGDAPEPTFQRLFAGGTEAAAGEIAGASAEPGVPASGWAWPALLSGAGLVAAWQLRKRAGLASTDSMRVIQRQVLGDKTTLVLVEVQDGQGATRRLLVGSANGALNLINDLGVVSAPVATPAAIAPGAVAIPSHDDDYEFEAMLAAPPAAPVLVEDERVDAFARMLDEVLEERGAGSAATSPAPVSASNGRFFSDEDLASPEAEPEVQPAPAPRATRPRFTVRTAPVAQAPAAWEPKVLAPIAVAPIVAAPIAAAPAPRAAAPVVKAGIAALVKGTLPAKGATPAVKTEAAPHASIAPPVAAPAPAPAFLTAFAPTPAFAPPVATPAPATLAPAAAERRLVGPPLRDPRLTVAAEGPRLRLANAKPQPAIEAPIPSVPELVQRLRAQAAEPQKLVVNGNVPVSDLSGAARVEGLKRRFAAIAAREGNK